MKKRCIIITAYLETEIRANVNIRPDDYIVCADGGFEFAIKEKIIPNIIIGDFDSSDFSIIEEKIKDDPKMKQTKIIKTQPEKDDTDTLMCVSHGIEKGLKDFIIIGGLGGRLDHTIANIQILSYLLDQGCKGCILDGRKVDMIKGPDKIVLENEGFKYFSAFSYTDQCTGVYETDSKYPLDNAVLNQSYPIGTSNEFLKNSATVKVGEGKLLIIRTD